MWYISRSRLFSRNGPTSENLTHGVQFDSCDKQCHFGKEIPKRAAYYPVIKNAIFAVASRQMSLLADREDEDSHQYVSECLPILIKALEDPMGHFDENLLAAVILLRTHEEMSGQ